VHPFFRVADQPEGEKIQVSNATGKQMMGTTGNWGFCTCSIALLLARNGLLVLRCFPNPGRLRLYFGRNRVVA
jgi:hypothetical protein